MKNILLHPVLKRQIAKEFSVTKQTVDMSLKFVFNSSKAKKIRKKAKQMLISESKKINE
ncbi:hypothetical protein [Tenacibaculum maritimum]|uniref:hypothetical protein n=1 Tax=Tenacibaculum maritimum TaxID=107401 RepID=UPI001916428F|nr:hypothetical protein [Tenacibaculum maritimum]